MAAKGGAGGKEHGVPLDTLKECLRFLEWFNSDGKGRSMQGLVVDELLKSYDKYYNSPTYNFILRSSLTDFLRHVSLFYKQISNRATAWKHDSENAEQITQAFSECLSKVHSAFSVLLFHVDYAYGDVGGGKLGDFDLSRPGDNALKTTLIAKHDSFTVLIPGGFDVDELNAVAGGQFAGHLQNALTRKTITPDLFTSVLFNNLEKDDWHKQDAGNVLLLLWAFCEYVERHQKGDGDLKTNLETELKKKGMCFKWEDLVKHCKTLKQSLDKLFGSEGNPGGFSTTGRAFTTSALKPEAFAGAFEKWFQKHWDDIGKTLDAMETGVGDLEEDPKNFAPESLYPYGIVLNRGEQSKWEEGLQNLPKILKALVDSGEGGLTTLKNILKGETCPKPEPPPPPSSPKAAKPPVAKPAPAKPTAIKTKATKTEAAKPVVTKAEVTKPVATKTEATKPVVNQAGTSPNQNNGRSDGKPTTSSVATSSSSLSSGSAGASGPTGTQGGKGQKGPPNTGSKTSSSPKNPVQQQSNQSPPQPAQTPQASPPKTPAGPGSPSQPGVGGGSSNGGGGLSQKPGGSSPPGKSQPSSVHLPSPQSTSASGNSGGTVSASVPGPPGDQGQGAQSGVTIGQKPVATQAPASPQPPAPPSSGVPAPGAGQGTSGQATTSGTTQQSNQNASHTSTAATTTVFSGSSSGSGAGPGGGSSTGTVGKDQGTGNSHGQLQNDKKPLPACKNGEQPSTNSGEYRCFRKPKTQNPTNKYDHIWEDVNKKTQNRAIQKHILRNKEKQNLQPRIPPTLPTQPNPQTPHTRPTPPSRSAPGPYPSLSGGRDGQGRRYFVPGEGRGRHDNDGMAVHQPAEFDGQPIPDTSSTELQEKIKKKVEGIKFLKSLESKAQQEEVEQLRRDENTVNAEQEKKARAEWEKRKQQGKGVKKHDEDLDRIQKTLQRSNRANESRLKQEEEQKKFIEAAPQLDGSQPSDDIYGERWPWWYPGLLYREVTGEPIEDDLPERLQDQRDRLFHEKIQDDLGRHIDERKALQTLERQEKDRIEQYNKDAEEKLRQGRIQHMQLNPPITTVLPSLPDPRELPDSLKHPDITFKVLDDTDKQSFAKKSKDAAQRIKDYYEKQRQRVEDEKKVYKEELEQKEKNATQAHVESIKRAKDIVQSEILQKKFHGGDFDIALAPSLRVDDFEENAHEAYRIYGPSLKKTSNEIFEYNPKWDNVVNYGLVVDPNPNMCHNPWNYAHHSATSPTLPHPTDSDHLPPPTNVKAMLFWLVGFNTYGLIAEMERHMEGMLMILNGDTFYPKYALQVNGDLSSLSASHIADTLTEACLYSAHVLNGIMRMNSESALAPIDFKSVYSKLRYSSDPSALLCQLRDYVYACHHQLQFLKAQCKRDKLSGGWQDCNYGSDVAYSKSPLQSFLTDGWDSAFDTHLFDPCNLCLKSRVRMGFQKVDLPENKQLGSVISTILTPSCGGSDPLLTLSSYLNCLTRRTPRTTGELVSFFHHFGDELHGYVSGLSSLGESLSKPHPDCPDWDHLDGSDLDTVRGIRGSETLTTIHNSKHDHPKTLSTLVGCGDDSSNCHPHYSPITYRAYALYSQSFAHTYLSWTVYLPDRLWESLQKLYNDMIKYKCSDGKSLYSCSTALPLLYLHGITPPEVGSQQQLTCQQVIAKVKEIVNGQPIATLMTAMDNFLYGIREPFIFTLVALWSLAFLIFANTMLYRIDVLHIRSHLIRTKTSHLIDVKALLTKSRKMLSLYKDVDYFDEDPIGQLGV